MNTVRRLESYYRQNRCHRLTGRQKRRLKKKYWRTAA